MFQSTTIPVLEQVINFTQARHGVLAGNIANLDTPGYQTRDLSPENFEKRLSEAIQSRAQQQRPISPGEMTGGSYDTFEGVEEATRNLLFHDQSDVSLESQIGEVSKNQMKHNLALTIMNSQFRLLQAAISERVV